MDLFRLHCISIVPEPESYIFGLYTFNLVFVSIRFCIKFQIVMLDNQNQNSLCVVLRLSIWFGYNFNWSVWGFEWCLLAKFPIELTYYHSYISSIHSISNKIITLTEITLDCIWEHVIHFKWHDLRCLFKSSVLY